jgi:stage II sporulation protein D
MTRILPTLAAIVVLGLAAASLAEAQTKSTFTIRGAGWGHGVGMSQYGAYGYAQNGWNAAQILGHYYTGTALGTTDPNRRVRVQLVARTSAARIKGARQAGGRRLDPAVTYTLRRRGLSEIELSSRGRRLAVFSAPLQVAGEGDVASLSGHGRYRGVLEFAPTVFTGLSVVNNVGLEEYLRGVVPAESPASWPLEALKAQAIAARTYAITTAKSGDFDHFADTRSQVYKGVSIEQPSTDEAIAQTRGQVVTYQGAPVVTYFFSTSGGRTESVENTSLGTEPRPWLQSVEDEYDSVSPRHRWTVRPRMSTVGRKLRGLYSGSFRGIKVTKRGESPRIVSARVIGSRGETVVDGATLRARLGLFDTWAYFTAIRSRTVASRAASAPRPYAFAAGRAAGVLSGSVVGPARGTRVVVQERRDGRWVEAGRVRTGRGGAYRWTAPAPGIYRVLVGEAAGPSVAIG